MGLRRVRSYCALMVAFSITDNHTMITDISASVLLRTIGWFVFVTIVVAVCVPVCSSHAHSMIVVDRVICLVKLFLIYFQCHKGSYKWYDEITCVTPLVSQLIRHQSILNIKKSDSDKFGTHWWAESPYPVTSITLTAASLAFAADKV